MVSSDKKKVTLQDFKKIGKGSIITFADFKIPDEKIQHKKKDYLRKNQEQFFAI